MGPTQTQVVMGATLPVFTSFDNPAAHRDFPARHLTWSYLCAVNAWLLLSPADLCCDWTMGTVPVVDSAADPRNAATAAVFASVAVLGMAGRLLFFFLLLLLLVLLRFRAIYSDVLRRFL